MDGQAFTGGGRGNPPNSTTGKEGGVEYTAKAHRKPYICPLPANYIVGQPVKLSSCNLALYMTIVTNIFDIITFRH